MTKPKVYYTSWCSYVRVSECDPVEQHILNLWAHGHPQPVIEDAPDAIFSEDYDAFKAQTNGKPVLWN